MLLRKINSVISLLITALLLCHAIILSVWMLSKGAVHISGNAAPWILTVLVALHAFISLDLAIAAHEGAEKRKVRSYGKLNRATVFQRISGILMLVFVPLHVANFSGFLHLPKIVFAIVPIVFFTIVLVHIAVSTSKALITLGIGNARFIKIVDVVAKVISLATLIAALTGFYTFIV